MSLCFILINTAYTMRVYPLALRDIAFRNFAYAGNVIGNCFSTSIVIHNFCANN